MDKYIWINEDGEPEGTPQTWRQSGPPADWVLWDDSVQPDDDSLIWEPVYFEDENVARLVSRFDVAHAQGQKWQSIKMARDALEFSTFNWGGYTFQCNEVSQRRIQGAVQLAALDTNVVMDWTLSDNSSQTFNATELQQIGQALGAHVNACHVKARGLRAAIDAATTETELDAINW